jgi:hypothetical protein
MKKVLFIIAVAIIAVVNSTTAQTTFQYFAKVSPEGNVSGHDINIYYARPFSSDTAKLASKFKFTAFALVEQGWAEAFAGVAYAPASWVEVGLGFGLEQNPALYRFCGSVWMGKGDFSFFTVVEKGDGTDNWWYKTNLKYSVKKFAFGLQSWRYQVSGPLVEYSPVKAITLWGMFGRDLESAQQPLITGAVVGIDIKL